MPRLITSMPCAFFSAILRSSWANRYGGMRSRRLLGLIQLLGELVGERRGVHAPCPAGQDPRLAPPPPTLGVPPVEVDGHRALTALEDVGHRRAARARPR